MAQRKRDVALLPRIRAYAPSRDCERNQANTHHRHQRRITLRHSALKHPQT